MKSKAKLLPDIVEGHLTQLASVPSLEILPKLRHPKFCPN